MYIDNLKIKNFRKITDININLNKNINIFIGNNAQGKTSILESIYVLALSKSFRNTDEVTLINNNFNFCKLASEITLKQNKKVLLEIILEKNNKTLKINKKEEKKVQNYLKNLNVIMFSPDDLDIIKKSPTVRRNLLNIELCQLFGNYMKILNEYNKLIKIRNEYFKKNVKKIDYVYLDIITEKLASREVIIKKYREKYIENINLNIGNIYDKIAKNKNLYVKYNENISYKDKEEIFKFYKENYAQEIANGVTLYGSHRDDLEFYLDGVNLKIYGSQGQQRMAVLAFKLAEINIFKEATGTYPIVLLDDIFSELDVNKRNNLLKFIKSNIQFIITTTDINNISKKILDKATIFKIEDGKIKKQGDKV